MSIKKHFNQYGYRLGTIRVFKFLFRKFGITFESFYLLEANISIEDILSKMNRYDYSDVSELSYTDFENSQTLSTEKLQTFQSRFLSKEYSCFGIKVSDEVVYYTWISWVNMGYPSFFNKKEELEEDQALLEDSYCDENFRGKGYHSKMNLYRLLKIYEHKKSKALVLILKENTPALKVQYKSGFTIIKRIDLLKLGKKIKIKETKV